VYFFIKKTELFIRSRVFTLSRILNQIAFKQVSINFLHLFKNFIRIYDIYGLIAKIDVLTCLRVFIVISSSTVYHLNVWVVKIKGERASNRAKAPIPQNLIIRYAANKIIEILSI
jgi:hypothetical protein